MVHRLTTSRSIASCDIAPPVERARGHDWLDDAPQLTSMFVLSDPGSLFHCHLIGEFQS
jgi:hypothetical protein